jgi:YD repeat-containing protein
VARTHSERSQLLKAQRHRADVGLSMSGVCRTALLALTVLLVGSGVLIARSKSTSRPPSMAQPKSLNHASRETALVQYGLIPLSFEPNEGQADPSVRFMAHGAGYALFLTANGASLSLQEPDLPDPMLDKMDARTRKRFEARRFYGLSPRFHRKRKPQRIRISLEGSYSSPKIRALDQLPGKANYFIGRDPGGWRTGIPTFEKVEYSNVYPGIDLIYYGKQGQLEFDYAVAPGADPNLIRLHFDSPGPLSISKDGKLKVATAKSSIELLCPEIYQVRQGAKVTLPGRFVFRGDNRTVGIEVSEYDHRAPLIIDPALSYSTYLGGNGHDYIGGVAVDSQGNAYVGGWTTSTNFPTVNGYPSSANSSGGVAFVAKLDPSGTSLLYSTYIGGTGGDWGSAIALDPFGDVYITGSTLSTDFPVVNAFQSTLGTSNGNAFVARISTTQSGTASLIYSTYLGGGGNNSNSLGDVGLGIAVDASGIAYVTGQTASDSSVTPFPTTTSALQTSLASTNGNAFLTVLNPSQSGTSSLVYSTYLGGNSSGFGDYGLGIAVDGSANAFLTGFTTSGTSGPFPTTTGAYQTNLRSPEGNVFVAEVATQQSGSQSLLYSTYLGGSTTSIAGDLGSGIGVSAAGQVYVGGDAMSADFPVTTGAYQTTNSAGGRAFVAHLDPTQSGTQSLIYSTFLGGTNGSEGEVINALAVDGSGDAFVAGSTSSNNFPTTSGAYQTVLKNSSWDAFLTEVNPTGTGLLYSSYFGGSCATGDLGNGIALDLTGSPYLAGSTCSTDLSVFPSDAYQTSLNGTYNAFLTRFALPGYFTFTGALNIPRSPATATLLNNGQVLIVGGTNQNTLNLEGTAEIYNPTTHRFTTTGSLNTLRSSFTATLLANGMVLIAGGYDSNLNVLSSAELYNPATGTFAYAGNLLVARAAHDATLLTNGTVLITGGLTGSQTLGYDTIASAELYDPATGLFRPTGTMNDTRSGHTATLLGNGQVLVAGGYSASGGVDPDLATAELYNPASGTFTLTGNMNSTRIGSTATILDNGKVLLVGGFVHGAASYFVGAAELYDSSTGTFSPTGVMNIPREVQTATLLNNGTVLIAGGQGRGDTTTAELYDPVAGLFSVTGHTDTHLIEAAVRLNDGTVLAIEGTYPGNAELYQPATLNEPNLISIAVAPANSSLPQGTPEQFTATGTFSDQSTQQLVSVTWNSSNGAIANLTNDSSDYGQVFGLQIGQVSVSACEGAICGSTSLTVSTPLPPVPIISNLAPNSAGVGTPITITGVNFGSVQGTSAVIFNGTLAPVTGWSATSITTSVPPGVTTGNLTVEVSGQQSNAVAFTVMPAIRSISPTAAGVGAVVTINGFNFGGPQSINGGAGGGNVGTVKFNATPASIVNWTNTAIQATVPPSAPTSDVVVTTAGGLASNGVMFTVLLPPTVVSLSPTYGPVGTNVTIQGSSFGTSQGSSTIAFDGINAAPTSWADQTVIAPVPAGATTGPVVINVGGSASNSLTFVVGPGITGLSPTSGGAGTVVTITGSGFGSSQGSSTLTFNGVPATPSSWSNSSISAVVPTGATSGLVLLSVGGISSNGVPFTISPSIANLVPTSGPVGTSVTILGAGFGAIQGSNTITFGGIAATVSNWSPNQILASVPVGTSTGPVVVSAGGLTSNGVTFTVGTGSIAGIISQASDASPVVGALVEALQSNATKGSATSGADGSYSISNLVPGTYDVRVTASGFGTMILQGNTVVAGSPASVNASLSTSGTISGKVTQSDGVTPVVGATVAALQFAETTGTATTNASGTYTISTLTAGSYGVQASAPGYSPQSQTGVTVSANNTTNANFSLAGQSTLAYSYDELGRLTGVVDSLNGAAAYSYDPVGNVLAISRTSPGQVTLMNFAPQSGPVGTTVTINGAGFGTTQSQNNVRFNGTNAAIVSASATQLVVSVPSGATTGVVAVTAPNGSVSSTNPFTVTTATGAPAISGFSPAIASTGNVVTISGSNFDAATNDRAKLNATLATVTSASPTTITANVAPSTSSGRITVVTPLGSAASVADLFVPPPPYTPSVVNFTGRIAPGGSFTGPINTGGQIGLVLFDGTAGQRVSVDVTNVNYRSVPAKAWVARPNTITLSGYALNSTTSTLNELFLDTMTLPSTGTYTIAFTNSSSGTGNATISLYNVTDVHQTIAVNGSPVTVTTSTPGQNAYVTFSGTAGQTISLALNTGTYSNCNVTVENPDGSTLTSGSCSGTANTIGPATLSTSGTFTIFIDPQGSATGSTTATLTGQ